jgi:hypothetical protein
MESAQVALEFRLHKIERDGRDQLDQRRVFGIKAEIAGLPVIISGRQMREFINRNAVEPLTEKTKTDKGKQQCRGANEFESFQTAIILSLMAEAEN